MALELLFQEPFLLRALLAGIGISLITAPLGCFVVWQRMAYLGEAMAHSGLMGIVLAMAFASALSFGLGIAFLLLAFGLYWLRQKRGLTSDTALGILSHSMLALGLVLFSLMQGSNLVGFLFGNILGISWTEIAVIYIGAVVINLLIKLCWKPLLMTIAYQELAQAEGIKTNWLQIMLLVLMAAAMTLGFRLAGVLLISSLLLLPAAAAAQISRSPLQMVLLSCNAGIMATILGLLFSIQYDTPSGPSIVLAAALIFLLHALIAKKVKKS